MSPECVEDDFFELFDEDDDWDDATPELDCFDGFGYY